MEYQVNINGLPVTAAFSEENIREIFVPLLEKLYQLQKEKGGRVLVLMAAPPGCGKSTLASFLGKLSEGRITVIGMDGFHRYQKYLTTNFIQRDGQRIPMVKIKGAPITFDLDKLTTKVRQVASGQECLWPIYDRLYHDPIEDAIPVSGDIVLLEGNYLLLNQPGWKKLVKYADYTISLTAEESLLEKRLVERHIVSGKTPEEAKAFVAGSDMANAREVMNHSLRADLCLKVTENGFEVI